MPQRARVGCFTSEGRHFAFPLIEPIGPRALIGKRPSMWRRCLSVLQIEGWKKDGWTPPFRILQKASEGHAKRLTGRTGNRWAAGF